jgi:PAS domain S-box-containing protein
VDPRLQAAIMANIPEGIALVRASDGVLVYVSDKWNRMFGYEPGELVGRHVSVLNASGAVMPQQRADEIIGGLERDGEWHGEIENVRKDSTHVWCAASVCRLEHAEHGSVWLAVHTDITERKRAELAVHEAEERFRSVFEAGPIGIVVLDTAGRLVEANEAFATLTGYGHDEIVGMRLDDLTHPDDRGISTDLARRVLTGELRRYRVVQRYVTKHGEAVPVAVTATTVRDAAGRPRYGVAIVEDGSARRAMVLSAAG